jgi:hypothetical protein
MPGLPPGRLALVALLALPLGVQAAPVVYTAPLDGASESPPVLSDGVGFAVVTLDAAAFTMRVEAGFSDLTGNVTVAHIHCCTTEPGSSTAGVATTVPTFPGFPAGVTSGDYDQTFDMLQAGSWNPNFVNNNGATVASAFAVLKAGLDGGKAYLNIHTEFAPGGEIRGFLRRGDAIFADGFEG